MFWERFGASNRMWLDRRGVIFWLGASLSRLRTSQYWTIPRACGRFFVVCLAQNLVVAGAVCVNELLAENELNASFIASPTVVRDTTILRSKTRLYHLANGLERVVPKDETSQKIEGKPSKDSGTGNPKKKEWSSRCSTVGWRLSDRFRATNPPSHWEWKVSSLSKWRQTRNQDDGLKSSYPKKANNHAFYVCQNWRLKFA